MELKIEKTSLKLNKILIEKNKEMNIPECGQCSPEYINSIRNNIDKIVEQFDHYKQENDKFIKEYDTKINELSTRIDKFLL